nr:uncharacterized protein LOC117280998 [Nicotiana tomentosiformis]
MGSLEHIAPAKRPLVENMHRLEGTRIRFSVDISKVLLACVQAKASLVERIKATQYEDEQLRKYKDEALAGKNNDMIVESDSVKAEHQRPAGLLQQIEILEWKLKTTYGGVSVRYTSRSSTAFHPQTDGQSERTIHILEYMLRACILGLGGSCDTYIHLAEVSYNNRFQSSIQTAPYEALYGRNCVLLSDGLKLRLLTAQSRQKYYADKRRRDLVFTIGDKVFLQVSPMKGVMRFGKRVFHVSMLRKYISGSSQVLEALTTPLDKMLSYKEEPMAIVDRQLRKL